MLCCLCTKMNCYIAPKLLAENKTHTSSGPSEDEVFFGFQLFHVLLNRSREGEKLESLTNNSSMRCSVLALSKRIELNWRIFFLSRVESSWPILALSVTGSASCSPAFLFKLAICLAMSNFSTSHHIALPHRREHTHEYPVWISVREMFWLPGWEILQKKDIPYHPISLYHFINVSFRCCCCCFLFLLRTVFISILPNFPSIIHHTFISAAV